MYLSIQIKNYAKEFLGLEQYSIEKFGEAFEVIPKTLAENAGLNVNEVMANLYSKNNANSKSGINIKNGEITDAYELGIFDHLESKKWAIRFSVDAILTVLRVDQVLKFYFIQIIVAKPAGGPNMANRPKDAEADEF